MDNVNISPGTVVGRWTVLDACEKTDRGEKKWLCRCECGTERYVLERSLRHGGSLSCGCVREEALRDKIAYDLSGKQFGELQVLERAERSHTNGGIWWECRCSCGNTCDVPASLLVTGRKTHCGCKTDRGRPVDISGQRFYRLTALYMRPARDKKGSVIWHCKCDCGNETDVPYNNLVFGNMKSCGCQKKEHDKELKNFLIHVGGTSIDAIKSKKLPSDNTTGYKGVYLIKGKYVAKIVFQKKAYYLGAYKKIDEAAEARKKAEAVLFDGFAAYYEEYRKLADRNPEWQQANPIQIHVTKSDGELALEIRPVL